MDPLLIREGIVVPADAMWMQASRSGGPGGQNVNKVASKVELRTDLSRIIGLNSGAIARLRALAAGKLDAEGLFLVVSQKSRDQRANLQDAREKVRALVLLALPEPRRRRKTKPSRGSVERRIAEKKHRGSQKANRRGADDS